MSHPDSGDCEETSGKCHRGKFPDPLLVQTNGVTSFTQPLRATIVTKSGQVVDKTDSGKHARPEEGKGSHYRDENAPASKKVCRKLVQTAYKNKGENEKQHVFLVHEYSPKAECFVTDVTVT